MKSGRRVGLLCIDPWDDPNEFHPFNYAIRRVQASLLHANLPDVEIHLIESKEIASGAYLEKLEKIRPDVIGASTYVWSFATMLDIACEVRKRWPETTFILGGPSARPAMFELPQHKDRRHAVSALVMGEGEHVFSQIVALERRDRESLRSLPGLALPSEDGWELTAPSSPIENLGDLPSPYDEGLVARGVSAHLETFRGCPLSCSFCQWGDAEGGSRVFSREYITRDLWKIKELGLPQAVLVDAGLNLNARAFRNLVAAEREVRVLRDIGLHFEVYPSHLNDEHLHFLSEIKLRGIGLGLQSFDKEVLQRLQRPFNEQRFEQVARELPRLGGDVTIEIILGLPGDSPESFERTFERARALPCNVRVYHCLVLPDALMTRGPSWAAMDYDPYTLMMRSCAGWSQADFDRIHQRLAESAIAAGGLSHETFWFFPSDQRNNHVTRGSAAIPEIDTSIKAETLPTSIVAKISSRIEAATLGTWKVSSIERIEGRIFIAIAGGDIDDLVIELADASVQKKAFKIVNGVAVSYRASTAASPQTIENLGLVCSKSALLLRQLVHGGSSSTSLQIVQ